MSSKSRKRSRTVTDENRADCPFTVTMVTAPSSEERDHIAKKRKRDGDEDGAASNNTKKELVQMSPFEPRGKFKSNQSMNLAYTVEPRKRWQDMTRYNSFVLNGYKYCNDDFVYVANEATIERQKATGKAADGGNGLLQSTDYWVARILEVRAADEHHVYARIYWMYSPDELPPGTQDGKKTISGRQPYHGQNELVASNHMDVINVVSVAMKATVHQWIESDDDEVQDALYWRQAFNCRTSQISSVDLTCKCQTPANPDKTLIGCTSPDCGNWLHHECLLHDVLMQVYERLGTDKPHISEKKESASVKMETDEDSVQHPLTPTETKDERTPSAIDVKGPSENGDHTLVIRNNEGTPKGPTQTPTPGPPNSVGPKSAKTTSAKKSRGKKAVDDKPYEGLFEASLKMNDGPMAWVISDLRPNIEGGDRTWTERAKCLVCNNTID